MESLRIWLEEGRPLMLLDVRPASERAEWSIPGSIQRDVYKQLKEGDVISAHMRKMRDLLHEGLCSLFKETVLNGHWEKRLPSTLNI